MWLLSLFMKLSDMQIKWSVMFCIITDKAALIRFTNFPQPTSALPTLHLWGCVYDPVWVNNNVLKHLCFRCDEHNNNKSKPNSDFVLTWFEEELE